jgi:drug/metabolite transporter (DMT)-like permease
MVLPFGFDELKAVQWSTFNPYISFSVIFIIVATTFGAYILNPMALRVLKASTVSTFLYLQPVIAGIFAIIMGSDSINTTKIIAAVLIFIGVYLVSKPNKKAKTI